MPSLRSTIFFLCKTIILSIPFNAAACIWSHGGANETINLDLGDVFVPRDAPYGSIIGGTVSVTASSGFRCTGTVINLVAAPPGDGTADLANNNGSKSIPTPLGHVPAFKTSLENVGVILITDVFDQHKTSVPRVSNLASRIDILPLIYYTGPYNPSSSRNHDLYYTPPTISAKLVYLGGLSSGSHSISKTLPPALLYAGNPITGIQTHAQLNLTINGSVTVSDCQIPNVSKQIEVPIGTVTRNIFQGKGSTSEDVNFQIPLTNCVAGSFPTPAFPGNYFETSNANIRLEGSNGSVVLDAQEGILGLNSDSDASGVAVQVLKADGSKLELGRDTPIKRLNDGNMNLDFKARYIQTSESPLGPEPGTANASANFTITYK